ncbi:DUF421 domain-containing protein [Geodermatophilus sp. TF02-6]|nr:DUF421 domain-containing protein [Geodermatophilus sp. TF02-6]
MYGTALLGLRVTNRRTLAQWTAMDFAAAVAIGAVVGRTAIASGQSYLVGAVALITLLAAHAVVARGRRVRWIAKTVDHPVRVLLHDGVLLRDQLRHCDLTDDDVLAKLRERGVRDLGELRYVLYETKGELTIVREEGPGTPDGALVRIGLARAADVPRRDRAR